MTMTERLLAIWPLSDNGKCVPLTHHRVIAEFGALIPSEPGQETLNKLVVDNLVEANIHGEYCLTPRGLRLRSKISGNTVPRQKRENRTGKEWNRFRKVLSYYIECVSLQERTQEYLRHSDYNRRFFVPSLPLHWLKELGDSSTITIPISHSQQAAFKLLLTRGDDDEEIYLGYPVSAFPLKNGSDTCYSPIGLIPVDIISFSEKTFEFSLRLEEAEINQSWLEFAFPKEEHQIILNAIYKLHANDIHRGQVDLLKALPLLEKNMAFNPDDRDLILPVLNRGDKGIHCNCAILFVGHSLLYSKTLKRELKHIRDKVSDETLDSTALAYIFRDPVLSNNPSEERLMPLPFIDSNPDQMAAIEAALNSPSVKVTGPPGTGKSQVAVNIIANQIFNGKSVLFSSKNHKAVEAIWERSQMVLSEPGLSLVNFCTKQDPNPWYKQDLDILIAGAQVLSENISEESIQNLNDEAVHWRNIAKHYGPRRATLTEYECWYRNDKSNRENMNRLFAKRNNEQISLQDFRRLKSCINNLSDKIDFSIKQIIPWIKWRLWKRKKDYKSRLYLNENYPMVLERYVNISEIKQNLSKFEQLYFEHIELEKKRLIIEKKTRGLPDVTTGEKQLKQSLQEISKLIHPALVACRCKKINELANNTDLVNHLKSIMTFMKSANSPSFFQRLKSEDAMKAEEGFKLFSQYYPGWAVTLLSLTKASPCIAHLFDTVIIDEASQCDPASIIPALFRASAVVFVGDSNQFPPVITMRPMRNDYLKSKYNITEIDDQRFDFLETSAFDLSSIPPILLREHFRCADEIADYFNSTFYANQLQIRTDSRRLCTPACMGYHHAVEWIDIRNSKGNELQATKDVLTKLIENDYPGSIGVVTPFREYADILNEQLHSMIANIPGNEDKLLINTANGFQGGERDVIIFVLGYNDSLSKGQFWYAESQENRYIYNVAVSRARACLIIIGDRQRCAQSPVFALNQLAQMPRQKTSKAPRKMFESPWEEKLYNALLAAGIETTPQYPLVGRRLDLACIKGGKKIDIEVDGIHYHTTDDGYRKMDDFYRDLQVGSVGWTVKRFWVYELKNDMESCVQQIKDLLLESENVIQR